MGIAWTDDEKQTLVNIRAANPDCTFEDIARIAAEHIQRGHQGIVAKQRDPSLANFEPEPWALEAGYKRPDTSDIDFASLSPENIYGVGVATPDSVVISTPPEGARA